MEKKNNSPATAPNLTCTVAMHSNRLGFEQKNVVIGANLDRFLRNYSKFREYIRITVISPISV